LWRILWELYWTRRSRQRRREGLAPGTPRRALGIWQRTGVAERRRVWRRSKARVVVDWRGTTGSRGRSQVLAAIRLFVQCTGHVGWHIGLQLVWPRGYERVCEMGRGFVVVIVVLREGWDWRRGI
jgi:hypothetical protein